MPQEDPATLTFLRSKLSPFLKAVRKALSIELEVNQGFMSAQKEAVFKEIFENLPAENSTCNFRTNLSRASETLQIEFDKLCKMNKQYESISFKWRVISFRSFQYVNIFKQTTHMLKSFPATNSNLSAMYRTQGEFDHNYHQFELFLGSSYLCWAFSCASMLRASITILIKKLFQAGVAKKFRIL